MNKKKIIPVIIIILIILCCIPIKRGYKDGGTVEYKAVFYSIKKVHSLYYGFGYMEGTQARVLFWNVVDDVELPKRLFEVTDEDFETIKYVNENSNIGVEFKGLVTGKGYPVYGLDGIYLSRVEINNNDRESDILGVRNDDTYGDATAKLEEHGFNYLKTVSISSSYQEVIYNKGRVAVVFYITPKKKMDEKNYPIRSVALMLYSERPLSEQKQESDRVL